MNRSTIGQTRSLKRLVRIFFGENRIAEKSVKKFLGENRSGKMSVKAILMKDRSMVKSACTILGRLGHSYPPPQGSGYCLGALWPRGRHLESSRRQVVSDIRQGGSWGQDGVGNVTGRDQAFCCPSTCRAATIIGIPKNSLFPGFGIFFNLFLKAKCPHFLYLKPNFVPNWSPLHKKATETPI